MDELDKIISKVVNKKVLESSSYENTIKNSLRNKKYVKQNSILKKVAIVLLSISTIGCGVFAVHINGKSNKIIPQQENNEYIQIVDNQNKTIEDLTIKINSIVIDDFNLKLDIDYLYTQPITSADSKILIKDENNNILFSNYELPMGNYFDNIFKAENKHKYGESVIDEFKRNEQTDEIQGNEQTEIIPEKVTSSYTYIADNRIRRKVELYLDIDLERFPNTKKVYIHLEDIRLKNGSKLVKELNYKWNFEIQLDEKFLNRNTAKYIQESEDNINQDFTMLQAELTDIQLKLKMKYNGNQKLADLIDMLNLNSIQIFDKKNNQYISLQGISISEDNIIKANYNINKNTLSDVLEVKIENFNKIKIIKKSSRN